MYEGTPLKLDSVLIEEKSRENKHIHEFSIESSELLLRPDFSVYITKHKEGKISCTVL